MKESFWIAKICLLSVFLVGLFMILLQGAMSKKYAKSNADAIQIAGLQRTDNDLPIEKYVYINLGETQSEQKEFQPLDLLPEDAAALADIRLDALREVNEEVIGWIEIPGTEVSYPVLQGEDNQYYLTHDWKKEHSISGAVFMECKSDPSLIRFHTIVYGHRMRNGTMFGSLKYYKNLEYWQEHPYVYMVNDSGIYRYDIFAAWEAEVEDMVYQLNLRGQEENFIRLSLEKSLINTGIIPGTKNRILTLSTCTGNGHARRWVVQAYMTKAYAGRDSLKEINED